MSERLARTGLLLPAGVGWVVALGTTAAPRAAPVVLVVALLALGPAVVAAWRTGERRLQLAAVAALVAGLLSGAAIAGDAARHPSAVEPGHRIDVEVQVESTAPIAAGRAVVRGTITAVHERAHRTAVRVPATLFVDGRPRIVPGAVVQAVVVLRVAPATDRSAVLGSTRGRMRPVEPAPPWQAAAQDLRDGFSAVSARLPGDGGALLPGLAIGDTSRVGDDLQQAMQDASLTHLTAVSGANCAVVVLSVLAVCARVRMPRVPRVLTAVAALTGFVVLVTPQPSVVRAAVMTGVGLACVLTGRRTAGAPALAVTVLVLLLIDPWIAWSAGFVLSALATAGLLLLAPPIADRLGRRMPRRLALLLAVPIAAQLACQPVLVLLQPGIPLFGVLANLLAEPAVPVATVLGLCACLLAPLVPAVAAGLALLAWLPATWIAGVARVAGGLPQLGWPAGAAGAALAAALLVVGLVVLHRRTVRPVRIVAAVCGLLALLVLAGSAVGGALGRRVGVPGDWTLAACDVGQGDGLVLRSRGRYAVVDTGREPGPILDCLDRLGVARIDLLVLTHWDDDHVGAAEAVAARVRTAFVGPADRLRSVRITSALRRAGARVLQVHRGDAVRLGALRLDVLWPPQPLGMIEPGNPASITLHVTGAGPSLLMTGDLGEDAQDALLAAGPLPQVDVVKVAHHGSADQSPAFYAAAHAALGVISVGAGNDYGHPTSRLLRILRAVGTTPVRTDQDGLVLVGLRDGRVRLWTERPVTAAVWAPAK